MSEAAFSAAASGFGSVYWLRSADDMSRSRSQKAIVARARAALPVSLVSHECFVGGGGILMVFLWLFGGVALFTGDSWLQRSHFQPHGINGSAKFGFCVDVLKSWVDQGGAIVRPTVSGRGGKIF